MWVDTYSVLQDLNNATLLFTPGSASSKEDEHTWQLHEECWKRMTEICNAIITCFTGASSSISNPNLQLNELEPIFLKSFLCNSPLSIALSTSILSERTKLSGIATELAPKVCEVYVYFSKSVAELWSFVDNSNGNILSNSPGIYSILVALLKLCGRANRVFATRSISAIELLIKLGLPGSIMIPRINEMISSPNKSIRQCASLFSLKILQNKPVSLQIEESISLGKLLLTCIGDASQDVRTNAVAAFKIFKLQFSDSALKILETAPPRVLKVLQVKEHSSLTSKTTQNSSQVSHSLINHRPKSISTDIFRQGGENSKQPLCPNYSSPELSAPDKEISISGPASRQVAVSGKFGASVRISKPLVLEPMVNKEGTSLIVLNSKTNPIENNTSRQPIIVSRCRISQPEIGASRIPPPRLSTLSPMSIPTLSRLISPSLVKSQAPNLAIDKLSIRIIDNPLLSAIKSEKWETRVETLYILKEILLTNIHASPMDRLRKVLNPLVDACLYDKHARVALIAFETLEILLAPLRLNPTTADTSTLFTIIGNRLCELIVKSIQTALSRGEKISSLEYNFDSDTSFLIKLVSSLVKLDLFLMDSRAGSYLISGFKCNSFISSHSFRAVLIGTVTPLIFTILPTSICIIRTKSILESLISSNILSDKSLRIHIDKLLSVFLIEASEVVYLFAKKDNNLSIITKHSSSTSFNETKNESSPLINESAPTIIGESAPITIECPESIKNTFIFSHSDLISKKSTSIDHETAEDNILTQPISMDVENSSHDFEDNANSLHSLDMIQMSSLHVSNASYGFNDGDKLMDVTYTNVGSQANEEEYDANYQVREQDLDSLINEPPDRSYTATLSAVSFHSSQNLTQFKTPYPTPHDVNGNLYDINDEDVFINDNLTNFSNDYDKTVILDPSELEGFYEHILEQNLQHGNLLNETVAFCDITNLNEEVHFQETSGKIVPSS